MQQRQIADTKVSAIGLGGMPMSIEGPARGVPLHRHHPRRARRRHHPHRHRRRLPHRRRRGRPQRVPDRPRPRVVRRRHLRGAGRHQGRSPASRRRPLDPRRLPGPSAAGRRGVPAPPRGRCHRALPVPPARPDGALRGLDRGDRATCSTKARSRWPASPTRTSPRSAWLRRSWAAGWPRCRTSSPRPSGPVSPSSGSASELGIAFLPWSPLGGIKNARRPRRRLPALRPGRAARSRPPRSRSRWPGCWPRHRWSSRSRDPAGPRPSAPPPPRSTCTSQPSRSAGSTSPDPCLSNPRWPLSARTDRYRHSWSA